MVTYIKGFVASNNGRDGIRIEGDADVHLEDVQTSGNGRHGINVLRHAGLLETLGLPKETDPKDLANLLKSLQNHPAADREDVVQQSGILQRIGKVAVDGSTFISNILSIAANPNVHEVIKRLSGGA